MNNNENFEGIEINIFDLAVHLLGKLWFAALVAVIAGIVSFFYTTNFVTPMYSSEGKVYVYDFQGGKISSSDITAYESLSNDYIKIMKSRTVLTQVILDCGLENTSYSSLISKISVSNETERFLTFRVLDADPGRAQEIANSFVKNSKNYLYNMVGTEQLLVVDSASLPTSPVSPNVKKNVLMAFLAGLFISLAVFAVKFVLEDRIVSVDTIEKRLGLNVIGQIPHVSKRASLQKSEGRKL